MGYASWPMGQKKRSTPEGQIQLSILKYLITIGAYVGKTKTMGVKRGKVFCFDPYTFRGFPDITCFWDKKIIFIEVKSGRNKQSNEQALFQQYCQEAGIVYVLAYDVQDVINIIH